MPYDASKESTIELLGIAGLVCAAGSGLQQFVLSINWIYSVSIVVVYGLSVVAWFLFMKMKKPAVILVTISTALMFLLQAYVVASGAILWLSFLVMLFCIIATVVIYVQELHVYISEHANEMANEPWNN